MAAMAAPTSSHSSAPPKAGFSYASMANKGVTEADRVEMAKREEAIMKAEAMGLDASAAAEVPAITIDKTFKTFDGELKVVTHESVSTNTKMTFGIYLPPQCFSSSGSGAKVPVLYWLSGLTCTYENFATKSGFAALASKYGICVVMPDTSPRGADVPKAEEGEEVSWDFGLGAGFYVNATRAPYDEHYNMFDYVTKELPTMVAGHFGDKVNAIRNCSIAGHSMGGLGALNSFLKNPGQYKSVSAFAPICNPSACPWGQKAFSRYFGPRGEEEAQWLDHDPCELVKGYAGPATTLLIDQGLADDFLSKGQLLPENLLSAAGGNSLLKVDYRPRDGGYDHSYWYIATYLHEHFEHHARALGVL